MTVEKRRIEVGTYKSATQEKINSSSEAGLKTYNVELTTYMEYNFRDIEKKMAAEMGGRWRL